MRFMIALLSLVLVYPAIASDDPYEGWSVEQLKTKVIELQKQVDALKASSDQSAMVAPKAATPTKLRSSNLKIDDFEADDASVGGQWAVGHDTQMSTTAEPDPFVHQKGGAPDGTGYCGRIHGTLGLNQAPWAWAALSLDLSDGDLSGYKAIEFWTKGDGNTHNLRLESKAVTDYAYFSASFVAPKKWTKVTIPLTDFKQPDWGAKVQENFSDVLKLAFYPTTFGSTYDFSVDNIVMIKQ